MKKLFTLLMTLVLIFSVSDVALADQAKISVSGNESVKRGDEVEYTVSLADCGKANTLAIEFSYDDDVLTKVINDCEWLVKGDLQNIDPVKNRGVWAIEDAKNLNGDIFKLAFTVNTNAPIGKTDVKVTVIAKNDNNVVVNKQTETITINVVCEHAYGEWNKLDDTNHVRICKNCQGKETEKHTWKNGTCTVCNAVESDSDSESGTTPGGSTIPGGSVTTPETDSNQGGTATTPEADSNQGGTATTPEADSNQGGTATTPETGTNQGGTATTPTTKPEGTKPGNSKPSGSATTPSTEESVPAVEMTEAVVNEKVEAIQKAEEGQVVVEMKQADGKVATVVPVEILEAVKGKDVDVVLDMGEYSWIINGKDVVEENLKDINLQVVLNTDNIDETVVKELAGKDDVHQISLTHDGEFHFKAKLKINVGKEMAGKFGNLYYHNDGKLEFMNAAEVNENGDVELEFEHASDYVVVVGRDRTAEEQNQDSSVDADVPSTEDDEMTNADNGGNTSTIIIVVVVIVVVAAGAFFVWKKKQK